MASPTLAAAEQASARLPCSRPERVGCFLVTTVSATRSRLCPKKKRQRSFMPLQGKPQERRILKSGRFGNSRNKTTTAERLRSGSDRRCTAALAAGAGVIYFAVVFNCGLYAAPRVAVGVRASRVSRFTSQQFENEIHRKNFHLRRLGVPYKKPSNTGKPKLVVRRHRRGAFQL